MALKTVNEESLVAIGDAIRAKAGTEDALEFPNEMINVIAGMQVIPDTAFVVKGDCMYRFSNDGWSWFINSYGDKITTSLITSASAMFNNSSSLLAIPFSLNFSQFTNVPIENMFRGCKSLKETPPLMMKNATASISASYVFSDCNMLERIGRIDNLYPTSIGNMFYGCYRLRELPEMTNWHWDKIQTLSYSSCASMFVRCYSLRQVPEELMNNLFGIWTSAYSSPFYSLCDECYTLDEIRGLIGPTANITSNLFQNSFRMSYRLKDVIFATQADGAPYKRNWKSQVIDLTSAGYMTFVNTTDLATYQPSQILKYNSGITSDKRVYNDETYQALKDDPDWFAMKVDYARYNHDSAVNTINSLPDTSAYGTNTIKFRGIAGSATDGGAINTLTEEEIAVATAKGWTVSFS